MEAGYEQSMRDMHVAVISHKICWASPDSPTGHMTDGGFPLQMEAISWLFSAITLVVPVDTTEVPTGLTPLNGNKMTVTPLTVPVGEGIRRKLDMLRWAIVNGPVIWRAVRDADVVHTPIPGDVGTVGMVFAMILRKRLFVRHCGNWLEPRTAAEKLWKWSMERFAGGRNVMLATGGAADPPSMKNPSVSWIFSSSLREDQVNRGIPRVAPDDDELRLIIACRQERRKGTDVVISALPAIAETFGSVVLDVVGSGSWLNDLKEQTRSLGIEDRVNFLGKVKQTEVIDLMRRAHVFCYPTSASEGFPKVVLEALASGLPVITTKVSVLPQLLSSGCGILLDDATPDQLENAVKRICLDRDLYDAMSRNAILTARRFSLENWSETIGEKLRRSWEIDSLAQDKLALEEQVGS